LIDDQLVNIMPASLEASASITDDNVTDNIAQKLCHLLTKANYTCGGTIKGSASEDSVTIRWNAANSIEKLTLPSSDNAVVQKLVDNTQRASFGFQGKDVIDESYRMAFKLDTFEFSTNFCPYEVGIIDVIGQTLLPRLPRSSQGIRAELYKPNV
jgi:hypothetical protein